MYVTVLCPSASPISKLYKWKFQSLKMVLKSFRGYCLLLYLLVNCRAISFKWELLSDNSRWQSRASPVTSTGQHLGELIRESIYADDVDLMVGTNSKIQALTNRLTDSVSACQMETATDKSKLIVDTHGNNKAEIYMNGVQLKEVNNIRNLWPLVKDATCNIHISIQCQWPGWTGSDLYKSLVVPNLLHGCEAWVVLADMGRESRQWRSSALGGSSKSPTWNEKPMTCSTITNLMDHQEPFLGLVRQHKLVWPCDPAGNSF